METDTPVVRRVSRWRLAGTVLGAIVLGAIGSGLWDRMGDPILQMLSGAVINGIDLVVGSYKDTIYRQASYGFREYPSTFLFKIFIFFLTALYLAVVVSHPAVSRGERAQNLGGRARKAIRSRGGFFLLVALALVALSSFYATSTQLSYTNRVILFAEVSIDRLAPFLTDQEEEELLASFRSVRSAADYYLFYDRIIALHEANRLPHHSVPPL